MSTLDLQEKWQFRQAGTAKWLPATVPGCTYTDLMALGKIPDPFVGDNEKAVQWVGWSDWEYARDFDADAKLLASDRVLLECDGLDTLATISVNGKPVAVTDNMYCRWQFDVKGLLKPGPNRIAVLFRSPLEYAKPLLEKDPLITPGHSIPGGVYVRKSPCQFGWDWGPKLPPAGIWRGIRLVGCNAGRITDVNVRQQHRSGKVILTVDVAAAVWASSSGIARISVKSPSGERLTGDAKIRDGHGRLKLTVEKPDLWWPNGYGSQPLYDLEVSLVVGGTAVHHQQRRIGLRKLELRRKPDKYGESFTFIINGVEIFAKGANWIPADSFPTRISDSHYRFLLQSAADAHMNMLRVWGGGFYEDERFYDLCDELGILIWQDFMFSCSHYPGDPGFEENVRREAADNIRRLRHRPCLALWCGNNEMEQGWVEWGWTNHLSAAHRDAYDRMFHRILPTLCAAEDPDTPYWPSSPSSNTPFQAPNAEDRGDGHYWQVWHGRVPFTEYRKHYYRFQSEFGFQSLPEPKTVAGFAQPEDRNMTSYIMEHHQRHPAGNGLIIYYMTQNFRMPKDFDSLCYLSQVLQAEAIRYGVEHWRRNRHRVKGTLYWQINDCWPVASWSSIDYHGRWKALHYAARRFYAPVHISAEDSGRSVALHVTNDTLAAFAGDVTWTLETLDGKKLDGGTIHAEVSGEKDVCLAKLDFTDRVREDNERSTVLVYELRRGRNVLERGCVTFVPSKHLNLKHPDIDIAVTEKAGQYQITLKSDQLARFVALQVDGFDFVFSDDYFDLPAKRSVTITCPAIKGMSAAQFAKRLRVRSVYDSFA